MTASLHTRVKALERGAAPDDGFTVIAIQIVSPGNLEPENRFCRIEGVTHTCGADELPADFDNRMRAVAEDLNSRLGRPIRMICSPEDCEL
jgi:hypothetical protein